MADLVTAVTITVQDKFSVPLQTLYDKLDSLRSILDVPNELADSFESGMDRVSTVLGATSITGEKAVTSMRAIAGAARDMATSVLASSGIAVSGIDALTESTNAMHSAGSAGASGSALADSLGAQAGPAASQLSENVSPLGSKLLNFGKDALGTAGSIASIASAVKDFKDLPIITDGFGKFKDSLKAMKGGIAKVIPTMITWAVANWSALWPILLIIAAILVLAAIVFLVIKYWEPISEFFVNLWEGIKQIFTSVWDWIKDVFSTVKDFFVGIFTGVWDWIVGFFNGAKDFLVEIFTNIWDGIKQAFEVGVQVLLWIVAPIPMLIIKYWEPISEFFVNLWEGIKMVFNTVKDFFVGVFTSVWDWITGSIEVAGEFLIGAFTGLWEGIKMVFSTVKDFFVGIFTGVWEWIIGFIETGGEFLIGAFTGLWEGIKGVFSSVKDFFVGIFTSVWEWIGEFFEGIITAVTDLVSFIARPFEVIGEFFGKLFNRSKNAGSELIDTMAEGAADNPALQEALKMQFSKTGEFLPQSDAKRGPFAHLSAAGRSIPQTIAKGVDDNKHTLSQTVSKAFAFKQADQKPGSQDRMMASPRPSRINIEKLIVQASEIEDLMSFMRILESASGYKRSYA